jgi:hypothetical protein
MKKVHAPSSLIPIKHGGTVIGWRRIGTKPNYYNSVSRRHYYRRSQMNFFQRWVDTLKQVIKDWLRETVKPFVIKWIVRPALIGTFMWLAGQVAMYKYEEYVRPTVFENVQAQEQTASVVQITDYFKGLPPALEKACFCESQLNHFEKDGKTVLTGKVTPSDIGICQISRDHHEKDAIKRGFNLALKDSNIAFAKDLYARQGLQPWSASTDIKTVKCKNASLEKLWQKRK